MAKRSISEVETSHNDLMNALSDLSSSLLTHTIGLPAYKGIAIEELIPMIVVVGSQSSGKSSLLSALTGIDFPIDNGKTTICRIEVRKRRGPLSRTIYYENDDKNIVSVKEELTIDSIKKIHESAKRYMEEKSLKFLADFTIIVEIAEPDGQILTFVDLPGLVATKIGGWDQYPLDLVNRYIKLPNCLIVQVLSGTEDIENALSCYRVQKADPEKKRTINVFTKMDNVQSKSSLDPIRHFDPNAILTVSRQYIDGVEKQTDVETELALLRRFNWVNKGRNHLLTCLSTFSENLLKENSASLRASLVNLYHQLGLSLQQLGRFAMDPNTLKIQWYGDIRSLVEDIKHGKKGPYVKQIRSFTEETIPSLNSTHQVNDATMIQDLNEIRGVYIHGIASTEELLKKYIAQRTETVQPLVEDFVVQLETAIKELLDFVVSETSTACRQGAEIIANQILTTTSKRIKELRATNEAILTDIRSNPRLYRDDRIVERLFDVKMMYVINLRDRINQGADIYALRNDIDALISNKRNHIRDMEIQELKIMTDAYWQGRISDFHHGIYREMNKIFDDAFFDFVRAVSDFQELNVLGETAEIKDQRRFYLEVEVHIRNSLQHLNTI